MKINKLYDYYTNGNSIKGFNGLIKYCRFPDGKTEEEKIKEIKNCIKNFWEKKVIPVLGLSYNEKSSFSCIEIKRLKERNFSNSNPNPINNRNETNQNSVTTNLTQSNQNTSQPISSAQTFNPFMNYTSTQPNNFYSQLPLHLKNQFIDLANKAQNFMNFMNKSQDYMNKSQSNFNIDFKFCSKFN